MAHHATQRHYELALEQYGKQYAEVMLDASAAVFEGHLDAEHLVTLCGDTPMFGLRIRKLDSNLAALARVYSKPLDDVMDEIKPFITPHVPSDTLAHAIDEIMLSEYGENCYSD